MVTPNYAPAPDYIFLHFLPFTYILEATIFGVHYYTMNTPLSLPSGNSSTNKSFYVSFFRFHLRHFALLLYFMVQVSAHKNEEMK